MSSEYFRFQPAGESSSEEMLFELTYREIFWNCQIVDDSYKIILDRVEAKIQRLEPGENYVDVDPIVHREAGNIVLAASNIRKMIFPDSNRKKGEALKAYQFRTERGNILQDLLVGLSLSEIHNRKVRNSLEHIDTDLDDRLKKFREKSNDRPSMALHNIILNSRSWIRNFSSAAHFRTYIADEHIFNVLGEEINLQTINDEVQQISQRVKAHLGDKLMEGMFIVFPDK